MKITPTRYEIRHNGHVYTCSMYAGRWTVTERDARDPAIPPYTSILTVEGWQPAIANHAGNRTFDSIDEIVEILETKRVL